MKELCSVLVSSCDKHQDAWKPFFVLFEKHWRNCPYKVYLNTESLCYDESNISVTTLNCNKPCSWSSRLKNALKKIDTKYIIFLLEDFFFLDRVNQTAINNYIQIMEKNPKIPVIDFEYGDNSKNIASLSEYNNLYKRNLKSMYFLNCQAAIWRRKDLIRFLSPYENAWQFEIFGTERAKLYKKDFLYLSENSENPFCYNVNWTTGYGLQRGKWLTSNIQLFNDNNIRIDFNNLGFVNLNEHNDSIKPPEPPEKVMIKERFLYMLFSGGDISPRLSIKEQLYLLLKEPKKFLSISKQKLIRCTRKKFY